MNIPETSIIIQTRKGRNIDNCQPETISPFFRSQFGKWDSKYPSAKRRTCPSSIYNCHGLTFAARRCFLENAEDILYILSDDNYSEVDWKSVLPGDIAVYYSKGDAEHSGVVVGKAEPPLYSPLLVSKWGSYAEVIHYFADCPYDCSDVKYYRINE